MPIFTKTDSDTKFLMHTDEPNGTLTFKDYSPNNYTITNQGTAVDHAGGFGGMRFLPTLESAAYFGGADNGFLVVDNTTIGDFGDDVYSGPFTIDMWLWISAVNVTDSSTREGVISRRAQGQSEPTVGGWFVDVWGSKIHVGGNFDGTWFDGSSDRIECAYPTDALFHHVAIVRTGYPSGLYQIYIDGVRGVSWQSGTGNQMQGQASDKLAIGNNAYNDEGTTEFSGAMEEIRISHVARWVDSFTPPNKPYSVIADDSVTDIAGIEDEANITTVGTGLVVKSNPGAATGDTVFSVNAKDGDSIIDVREDKTVAYDWDNVVTREGMISNTSARHGVIKASFKKDLTNDTATDFFRIECYNHNTGGSGCFSCIIHLMMSSQSSASSSMTGMMSGMYMFGTATRGSGLSATSSPMQVIEETPQVNSLSASMGSIVLPIAVTIQNNSNYQFDIQIDADARYSNDSAGIPQALAYVEVMWRDYAVGPTLSQL